MITIIVTTTPIIIYSEGINGSVGVGVGLGMGGVSILLSGRGSKSAKMF